MMKTTSCKKTSESPGCSSSLIVFCDQSEAGNSNASGAGSVRVSAQGPPGARLDLTVNFHYGHLTHIDPTNCPWVSEAAFSLNKYGIKATCGLIGMLINRKNSSNSINQLFCNNKIHTNKRDSGEHLNAH